MVVTDFGYSMKLLKEKIEFEKISFNNCHDNEGSFNSYSYNNIKIFFYQIDGTIISDFDRLLQVSIKNGPWIAFCYDGNVSSFGFSDKLWVSQFYKYEKENNNENRDCGYFA